MKYFKLIDKKIDIQPLLKELHSNENLWLANTSRQDNVPCQRKTNSIFLRVAVERDDLLINENQESIWSKQASNFPLARQFMEDVAEKQNGTLSRAVIVRLAANSQVYPHIDHGSYYKIRDRYHLPLKSTLNNILISGDEQRIMREGELWWFDNNQHHAAINQSEDWRIHYIFDILPDQYKDLGHNPALPSASFKRRAP